jgi:uncharacterized membrane protein
MFGFPPMPPFEGLHPIVVHFPIGILLIAWLPMLIGLVDRKRRNTWFASAAMLLVVGTIAAFAAVLTGEAAEDIVGATSQVVNEAIHEHEETAERARNLFLASTLIFLMVWGVYNKVAETKKPMILTSGTALVTIVYLFAVMALTNAGRQGGVLVHQHGLHAPLGGTPGASSVIDDGIGGYKDDDDD